MRIRKRHLPHAKKNIIIIIISEIFFIYTCSCLEVDLYFSVSISACKAIPISSNISLQVFVSFDCNNPGIQLHLNEALRLKFLKQICFIIQSFEFCMHKFTLYIIIN